MDDYRELIAHAKKPSVVETEIGPMYRNDDRLIERLVEALETVLAVRAVVEAQALEQAAAYANQMHAEQGGLGEARIRADWLRARAVEIREGRQ